MIRAELSLSDEHLLRYVAKFWDFQADTIRFIDIGFAFAFHVKNPHSSVFLKVYKKDKPSVPIDYTTSQTIIKSGNLLNQLKKKHGLENISSIICTKEGTYFSEVDDYLLVLYDFIEGVHPSYEPNELDSMKLAKIFNALHRIPITDFPEISKETFDIDYALGLQNVLQSFKKYDREPNEYNNPSLADIRLEKAINVMINLKNKFENTITETVLTHGDAHHYNVLQTPYDLFLIDWDSVKIAPRERDLWHYEETPLIDQYLSLNPKVSIDHDLCFFYQIQRFLEDIRFYLEQSDISEEQRAENRKSFLEHWGWTVCLNRLKEY